MRTLIFFGLLIFSLIAIFAAVMGMCACKIEEKRWYNIAFGCILLPTWIIIISVGAASVALSSDGKDKLMAACHNVIVKINENLNSIDNTGSSSSDPCTQVYETDIKVNLEVYESMLINEEMCSSNCPCKVNIESQSLWTEKIKTQSKRCRPFDFSGSIETYKDCLMRPPTAASDEFKTWAVELTKQPEWAAVADLVEFFEDNYHCSGVCKPALFYFSKSVELGLPTGSCVGNLKDAINSEFGGLGAATLCSGVLLLAIFIMQYCLWKY